MTSIDFTEARKEDATPRASYRTPASNGEDDAGVYPWPEPDLGIASEQRLAAPDFPIECLGEFWGDWTARQAEARSVPIDYVAGSLLACAAGLIGNARRVSPWPEWSEPCTLWMGLVGKPSAGKSPGKDAPLALVTQVETELAGDFPNRLREWETAREVARVAKEKWQADVREAAKQGAAPPTMPESAVVPDKPARPRVAVTDTSIEALSALLAQTARGLLFHRDELAGWIGNFDRYGGSGGDRAFWVEAFGGRPYVIDRVKHGDAITIPHLSVSVLGGIQPDRLRSLLTTGDDDGLASRFLFTWPEPVPPERPRCIVRNAEALTALKRLYDLRMSADDQGNPAPLPVRLADDAATVFQDWRAENFVNEGDSTGLYASHVGKLPGLTLRLALVLELLRWAGSEQAEPERVSITATGYAAHLIDTYFKPMAVRVYGDAALPEEEVHAAAIARRIRKEGHVRVNARHIRRQWHLPGLRAADKVTSALRVLEDAHWIRPAPARKGETAGRQTSDFVVNPSVLGAL